MQNPTRTILAAVTGLMLAMPQARAESLADVMVEAWKTAPELAAQRATVKVFSESAAIARAGNRPTIQAQIGLNAQVNNSTDFVFPTTLSLTVSQALYTGGQVENRVEAAEKRITREEARLIATEQSVLLNAALAFLDIRRDQALVQISQNNVRVLTEQLRAANQRFEVGEVTRTDVEQARARLAAARSTLAANMGALAQSRERFARAVGRAPGDLDPLPPLPDLPDGLEDAIALAAVNEPNVRVNRIERDASGSDVRAAMGALLPQVSLQGQLSQQDVVDDGLGGQRAATVGVNVTIPIWAGGANYAGIRQAQANAEIADANISTALRTAAQNVGTAWASLEVARASIKAGRLEVRAAQLAFEGVREEAKVGARTTLDVLDAEQEVLNARASLARAIRDEYAAAYSLLSAMGLLTVDHMGLDVGLREAAGAYYASVRDRNFGYDQTDDTVWTLPWRP